MKFDQYHPLINLLFFGIVFYVSAIANHPVYVTISFLIAFLYYIALKGIKGLCINIILLILGSVYFIYYVSFHHFGITPIAQTIVDNSFTLESIVLGLIQYIKLVTICMWFNCFVDVFSADKVMYVLGKFTPKLSLFISVFLRFTTKIAYTTKKTLQAQKAIGKGIHQGRLLKRIGNAKRVCSIVVVWFLDDCMDASKSMIARGYSLKNRTHFSQYRFDNRDRFFVVYVMTLLAIQLVAYLLGQMVALYNPMIIIDPVTIGSYVFYSTYAILLLLPMMIQIKNEILFDKMLYRNKGKGKGRVMHV